MTDPRPSPRTARSAGLSLLALSRAGWQRVGVVLLLVGAAAATHCISVRTAPRRPAVPG